MAVRIQKSAVNIREKLAELERPIGVNGAALMATNTPQDAFSLIGAGRRNILINGDHSVNQRGLLPVTGTTTDGYQATDRWKIYRVGITADASISSVTLPNGIITNALKATATSSSASGVFDWYQSIEDKNYNSLKGRWVTLSGWIRSNNPNAKLFLWGGSAARQGYASHSGNGQWQYLSFSCIVSTSINALEAYAAIGSESALGVVPINSGDYIEFALMQLEEGRVATPFEYRSYGQELALCKRYYEFGYFNPTTFADQYGNATWQGFFSVEKRSTGTLSYDDGQGNSSRIARWFTSSYATNVQPTGLSVDNVRAFSGYIGSLSAGTLVKVGFHWQQNSEL